MKTRRTPTNPAPATGGRRTAFARKAVTGAVVLSAAAVGAWTAPAGAQEPEGIAEFATEGPGLDITAPSELSTVPALVPEREDFAFLGEAGDLVWVAGTVDGRTFPTLDASEADTDVTVGLEKVEGPGEAWLYTFEGPGFADPLTSTAGGESFTLTAGTTTPVVLAVDQPGQYTLELVAREDGEAKGSAAVRGRAQVASSASAVYSLTADEAATEEAASLAAADEAGEGNAQAAASCEAIADGHVDIGPRFVDGTWTAQLRDDRASESVWRDLPDTVIQVPDTALFPIPEGDFGFLGEPGQEIYMLPQVQASDIVWPGWNTQDASVIEAVPGSVEWNLTAVDGPGDFTLFLTGTFGGADVLFDSAEALPQSVAIPRNTHAHGNWTFSEAGVYHLTVEFTATTADGETVSDTEDVQLAVGDATDPDTACSGGGAGPGGDPGHPDDDKDGWLPTTGTGWLLWGLGAAALAVIVGAVIMAATRKRRHPADRASQGGASGDSATGDGTPVGGTDAG